MVAPTSGHMYCLILSQGNPNETIPERKLKRNLLHGDNIYLIYTNTTCVYILIYSDIYVGIYGFLTKKSLKSKDFAVFIRFFLFM